MRWVIFGVWLVLGLYLVAINFQMAAAYAVGSVLATAAAMVAVAVELEREERHRMKPQQMLDPLQTGNTKTGIQDVDVAALRGVPPGAPGNQPKETT